MTVSSLRSVTLMATALLVMGGCAVPGKGEPGVAAEYRDRVITEDDVTAIRTGFDDLHTWVDAGEDLTLLLIGPEVVATAEQHELGMTDDEVRSAANLWVSFVEGPWAEPSPGAKEIVRVVMSIFLLMEEPSGEGLEALFKLARDVEAHTVASPKYGEFTLTSFAESISAIIQYTEENQTGLGPAEFIVFKEVNGFSAMDGPDWISGG